MMYVTMMPVIIGGIANLYFCQSDILEWAAIPIDGGYSFRGKRILGAHKTWKRFWGMIVATILAQVLWGVVLAVIPHFVKLSFLESYGNGLSFNLFMGFLLGTAYVLFELPNSFIKRRLVIPSGKRAQGHLKWLFLCLDHVDSVIGCVAMLAIFYDLSFWLFLGFMTLGGLTHLAINIILHRLQIRQSRF